MLLNFISQNIHLESILDVYYFFLFQYMAKDTSPLSVYVMHPFWNKVVEVSGITLF